MGMGRVRRLTAFRWVTGCALLSLGTVPVCAQTMPEGPAELDPSAPLDPMPDLGVEWPDMNQADPAPPPEVQAVEPEAAAESTRQAAERVEDATASRSYQWTITGLEGLAEAEEIRRGFDER
ncbi:MAG TPA: hypothetical protein VFZ35_05455, partial [Sphingomicrobium sp.]